MSNDIGKADLLEANQRELDIHKEGFEDGAGRTWNPLALWTKAWTDSSLLPYNEIENDTLNKENLRKEYISRIAFLNIKKEAGESSVKDTTIKNYLEDSINLDYIKQEIEICRPDVVIVCGVNTYTNFKNALQLQDEALIVCLSENRELSYRVPDDTYLIYYDRCIEANLNVVLEHYQGVRYELHYDEHYQCHLCNPDYTL